jgi:hypothetical protein
MLRVRIGHEISVGSTTRIGKHDEFVCDPPSP